MCGLSSSLLDGRSVNQMDYWLIVCAGGWVGVMMVLCFGCVGGGGGGGVVMMVALRMEEWSTDMES